MKLQVLLPAFVACASAAMAHPMGNSSVSHYSRVVPGAQGARIRYVLDLAEIPTLQLLQSWKLDATSPREEIERRATETAAEWARGLRVEIAGHAAAARVEKATATFERGTLRVVSDLAVEGGPGALRYRDGNYPDRGGWKEIVVGTGPDRSNELTVYPADALAAPPQDVETTVAGPAETGSGLRSDYLARLLHQGELGWGMIFAGMAVAFGLGAVHALSPGHGKTIVAAYLVGTRGTPKHAIFLGGMVTFTHTVSVFFLGLATLFLSQYVIPEKIYPVLGAISGLSIVWIGTMLFFRRLRAAGGHSHPHHHHPHHHGDGALVHDHGDGHVHSHVPERDVTLASLIALGASGGLVPCPSALVLLLSSIALGRVALGLTLLVAFSAGLAIVLMGIGLVVLYAKHLLPDGEKTAKNPLFRWIPVASAGIITCAGIVMTAVALGVIRPFGGV